MIVSTGRRSYGARTGAVEVSAPHDRPATPAVPARRVPAARASSPSPTSSAATPASSTRCAGKCETAAPFIGIAFVLDMLDGRIARHDRHGERVRRPVRFARRRHLVRHRAGRPVVPMGAGAARTARVGGGISVRHRRGHAAGALQHSGAPLAPTNATSSACPAPPRPPFRRRRCSSIPAGFTDYRAALPALAIVLVPAVLMVSTIRFRSFKTIDLRSRRPYTVLLLIAAGIVLIVTHVQIALVVMAYTYLASAFIGMAITRVKQRGGRGSPDQGRSSGDTSSTPPLRDSRSARSPRDPTSAEPAIARLRASRSRSGRCRQSDPALSRRRSRCR